MGEIETTDLDRLELSKVAIPNELVDINIQALIKLIKSGTIEICNDPSIDKYRLKDIHGNEIQVDPEVYLKICLMI